MRRNARSLDRTQAMLRLREGNSAREIHHEPSRVCRAESHQMSNVKPYCARTLRMVARELRADSRRYHAKGTLAKRQVNNIMFYALGIAFGERSTKLQKQARALERKAKP